jgi:CHAT domain-containing protein
MSPRKIWATPASYSLFDILRSAIRLILVFEITITTLFPPVFARHSKEQSTANLIAGQQLVDEGRELTPGEAIRRRISVGERHSYRVFVSSGQYLGLLTETQDVSLGLTLLGPDRHQLRDIKTRQWGPTTLSLISNVPTIYRLEVRCLNLERDGGNYQLSIELRNPRLRDRTWIAAEVAFVEADSLRDKWTEKSFLKSINKYDDARKHLTLLNNPTQEAYALKNLGDIYAILGRNQEAIKYYDQLLGVSRKLPDRRWEIEAYNDLSSINIDLGNKQLIFDYSKRAQMLSKETGILSGEAVALNNIGACYSYVLGDREKSLEFFTEALKLSQTGRDFREQALSITNLGHAYMGLGDVRKALSHFNRALPYWQSVGDHRQEALVLTAIGLAHSSLGEMFEALSNHNRAIQLLQTIGDRIGEAVAFNGTAYVYNVLGEPLKALNLHSKALVLYRAAARRAGEAVTLGAIGQIYQLLGHNQKALECHYQKLAISRAIENRRAEAYTLRDIGVVFDSLGEKSKALQYYNQALLLSRNLHDPRGEAYSLVGIGSVYDILGDKQKALDLYRQSLALMRSAEDRAGEMQTLHKMVRVELGLGDLAEASKHGTTLLGLVEALRNTVANREFRISYFASVHQHYELQIDVLMSLHKQNPSAGFNAAALEISERARGRSLLDMLNEAGADIRQGVDPALLQQERDLQQLLNSKAERQTRMLSLNHTEEQVEGTKKEIGDLTVQYEEVLARIRSSSPRYAALTQPHTLTLSEIQQDLLDDNTICLEYSLGDERSYLWAVTPTSVKTFQLPGRAKIEEATRLYRAMISFGDTPKLQSVQHSRISRESAKSQLSQAAADLSRMLLEPIAPELGRKRLLIIADGALHYVPFAALPDPGGNKQGDSSEQPVIVDHEVVNLPSLSVLAALRREIEGRTSASKSLAVLADPVFEADDPRLGLKHIRRAGNPNTMSARSQANQTEQALRSLGVEETVSEKLRLQRLPFAGWEAMAITNLIPRAQCKLALGLEASISTATSAELSEYRIVHFATHALVYGVHPQLYGIVLSLVDEQGHSQDGFLRLNEIYNLKLRAELVVLSACQTALGKEINGEGLVGLTRGFMYAGAPRIVATLWKVDDRASAELMKSFYDGMFGKQGLSPAAALQAAQVAMWKNPRWKSPFYWAAFLLQGEFR